MFHPPRKNRMQFWGHSAKRIAQEKNRSKNSKRQKWLQHIPETNPPRFTPKKGWFRIGILSKCPSFRNDSNLSPDPTMKFTRLGNLETSSDSLVCPCGFHPILGGREGVRLSHQPSFFRYLTKPCNFLDTST